MPHPEKPSSLPTLHRIRDWIGAGRGWSGGQVSSLLGIVAIVALAAAFLSLATRGHRADAQLADELNALRIASEAENDLANIETAHRGFLLTGQAQFLDQFQRRREAMQERLLSLVPLLGADRERREDVRGINSEFERWLSRAGLPQIEARRGGQVGSLLAAGDPGRPIMDELRKAMSRFVRAVDAEYDAAREQTQFHRTLQNGGFALLSAVAAGFLIASTWTGCATFRRHLRKTESGSTQTQQIVATTLDGVVTFDGEGSILSLNPAAEKMFQQSEGAVVGQNVGVLIPQRLLFHDIAAVGRGMVMAMGQRQGYYPFPIEISRRRPCSRHDKGSCSHVRWQRLSWPNSALAAS